MLLHPGVAPVKYHCFNCGKPLCMCKLISYSNEWLVNRNIFGYNLVIVVDICGYTVVCANLYPILMSGWWNGIFLDIIWDSRIYVNQKYWMVSVHMHHLWRYPSNGGQHLHYIIDARTKISQCQYQNAFPPCETRNCTPISMYLVTSFYNMLSSTVISTP